MFILRIYFLQQKLVISIQLYGNMGNEHMESEAILYQDWTMIGAGSRQLTLWRSRRNPQLHIEQTCVQTNDRTKLNQVRNIYLMRKDHPRMVAALYLDEKENNLLCAQMYEADVFIEKIPIRLFDLSNVPFPDVLHMYYQALLGYHQLARKIGTFRVESEYMGINESGVLKVWAGAIFSSIRIAVGKISQQDMVESVISCIEESINKSSIPKSNPSIRNFIYRTTDRVNFLQAIAQFQAYVRMTNAGQVPARLACLNDNTGLYIRSADLLPSDRKSSDNYVSHKNKQNMAVAQKSSYDYMPRSQSQYISSQRNVNGMRSGSQRQITTFQKVESTENVPVYNCYGSKDHRIGQNEIRGGSHPKEQREDARILPARNIVQNFSQSDKDTTYYPQSDNAKLVHNAFYRPPMESNGNVLNQKSQNYFNVEMGQSGRTQSRNLIQQQRKVPQYNIYLYPPNTPSTQPISRNSLTEIQAIKNRQQINSIPVNGNPFVSTSPQPNTTIKQVNRQDFNNNHGPTINLAHKIEYQTVRQGWEGQFTSQTIINQDQSGYMHGVPKNQLQGRFTPLSNLQNNTSRLQSIEEVNTERYSKTDDDSQQCSLPYNPNFRRVSHVRAPNNSNASYFNKSDQILQQKRINARDISSFYDTKISNNYARIENNDGKSSEQFMAQMKSMSFESRGTKQKQVQLGSRKKNVSFTNNNEKIIYDSTTKSTVLKLRHFHEKSDPSAMYIKEERPL